ncbi:MAG: tRNA adenosine(34) deaminase TadA [Clostridia bacterium]|nr:tRNA adenosine(34) deaminase TadA [Clostridia bacterium]
MDKIRFMRLAIKEAQKAETYDEVPIGAVIVKDGKVIARAHNKKETKNQATRHAEIEAIEKATKKVGNWWLEDCDIYVTLEPCAMCAGALINSRLRNIYFGAYDKKAGCCGSLYNLPVDTRFNHRLGVEGGILQEECATLLTNYFKKKRK